MPKRGKAALSPETSELLSKKPRSALAPEETEPQTYENGVIRTVIVENFMNHGHMRIDLDPHINFIVGKNGSGKSAIVASLMTGLACRAMSTGRNLNSYKHFIKHGQDYALVQIHLANNGVDPFKFDEFGGTIVVEHRIEKSGGGSYRLKSGCGKTDKRVTKKDIEELSEHFNIQAENPCVLLTQEAAKKFLHNGNEESRYKFFLGAANLDTVKEKLQGTKRYAEEMQEKTDKARERMPEFEEMAKKAKDDYDGAVHLKKLEKEKQSMEPMVAWAQVASKEREIQALDKEAKVADEGLGKVQEKVDKFAAELQQLSEGKEAASAQHKDVAQHLDSRTAELQKLQQAAKIPQKKQKEAKRALEQARADRLHAEQQLEHAKANHAELEASLETRQQAIHAEREAKKRDLEDQKARAEKSGREAQQRVRDLQAEDERLGAQKAGAQSKAAQAKERLQIEQQELSQASKKYDAIQAIHPQLPQLIQQIKAQQRQFRDKVAGPLGAHIKLNEGFGEFALAAEAALRPNAGGLARFVVSCTEDEQTLRKLAATLPAPQVRMPHLKTMLLVKIRPRERRFVQAKQHTLEGGTTLLQAVTIDDDDMHNEFLESFQGGQMLLFRDQATAAAVMNDDERRPKLASGAPMPQLTAYANDDTRNVFVAHKGGTKAKEWTGYQAKGLLIVDQSSRKELLQQQVQTTKREVAEAEEQARALDSQRKQGQDEEKKLRRDVKGWNMTYKQAHDGLKQLDSSDADEAMSDLTNAAQDVADEEERIEEATAREHAATQDAAAAKAEYEPAKQRFDELKEQVMALQEESQAKLEEAQALDGQLKKKQTGQRQLDKELEAARRGGDEKREQIRELEKYIAHFSPQVEEQYGARVDDPKERSIAQLRDDFQKLNKRLEKAETKHGGKPLGELEQLAIQTAAKLREKTDELEICKNTFDESNQSFVTRYKHFRKECKNKGKQAALDFNGTLSRKQHAGELDFDHAEERLSLKVCRNSQDTQAKATSDARTLSGGERSYTTLAFELAMWEFCETPFRCLDEFDVYMDDTYRKIAVDTLMELCENQPNRQFIFITPQDMHPFLRHRQPCPRIIRMKDVRPDAAPA